MEKQEIILEGVEKEIIKSFVTSCTSWPRLQMRKMVLSPSSMKRRETSSSGLRLLKPSKYPKELNIFTSRSWKRTTRSTP